VLRDAESAPPTTSWVADYRNGQQFRPPPDWSQRFGQPGGQRFSEINGFQRFLLQSFWRDRGFGAGGGRGHARFGRRPPGRRRWTEAFAGTNARVALNENGRLRQVECANSRRHHRRPIACASQGVGGRQLIDISHPSAAAYILTMSSAKTCKFELPAGALGAALGAKVAVPTLKGTVELTVPAGAQSGQKLRLRARGFPGTPSGDQIVTIKLVTPAAQTRRRKRLTSA